MMIEPIGDYLKQTFGTAVRPTIKLLAFAMFLPVITGFGATAPHSSAEAAWLRLTGRIIGYVVPLVGNSLYQWGAQF